MISFVLHIQENDGRTTMIESEKMGSIFSTVSERVYFSITNGESTVCSSPLLQPLGLWLGI